MANKEFIEREGTVTEALPGGKFIIKLDDQAKEDGQELTPPSQSDVTGYLSGKMRKHRIWILPGDRVKLEFSEYDPNNCRITYRFK